MNLRTWGEWTRDIHLDNPEEVAEMMKWESRIAEYCRLADSMKHPESGRPANPGVGCLSCAYRHICPEAWTVGDIPIMDGEALATELATVDGRRSLLITALKAMDAEIPITIPGGWVGFKEIHSRIFKEGQERALLDEWLERLACDIPEADMPVLVSLLAALKIGKGNLDAFAKAIMPERKNGIVALRDEYVESLTVDKRAARFGVWEAE